LVVLVGILSLRYVYPYFGVDVEGFEKKTWFGNGAVLVFTWLSIWVLLLNPPFSDMATPDITKVQVSGNDGANWTAAARDALTSVSLSGPPYYVAIKAKVTDNVGISRVVMEIDGMPYEVSAWAGEEEHTFGSPFEANRGDSMAVVITAEDDAGHETRYSFRLSFPDD